MTEKIYALLGFARKAGKLAIGTEAVFESVAKKRSKLVLIAADISQKSAKEVRYICDKNNTRAVTLEIKIDDVTAAIGRRAGILSVEDDGFANAIAQNI